MIEDYLNNKLPLFARSILEKEYISVENKIEFINKFLDNYLNNEKYTYQVEGSYLLFINNKYEGLFSKREDMSKLIKKGDTSIAYMIDEYYPFLGHKKKSLYIK